MLLKKGERVIAYRHMHIMSLVMAATLSERKLRSAMKHRSITSLPLYPEARQCAYPTMCDISRLFRGVERYEVIDSDHVIRVPAQLKLFKKQLLNLMEGPVSL